jgi:hypothetical protein
MVITLSFVTDVGGTVAGTLGDVASGSVPATVAGELATGWVVGGGVGLAQADKIRLREINTPTASNPYNAERRSL